MQKAFLLKILFLIIFLNIQNTFLNLYFISVIGYWFTSINKTEGMITKLILLCAIPFYGILLNLIKDLAIYRGLLVLTNFLMSLGIIRNSLKKPLI